MRFWLVLLGAAACVRGLLTFQQQELDSYKEEVRELIGFALDKYLEHGFPHDEVRPLTCRPKTRNYADPEDQVTNDVLGNFTATLVDSLTTLAVIGDKARFAQSVQLIKETLWPGKFNLDSVVQVFETSIRILGGLISSHLYASDHRKKVYLGHGYDGFLLELAIDLADRLIPAYFTDSGLPLSRIHLASSTVPHLLEDDLLNSPLVAENNVAAIASPMFEFTMLSYLTGDAKYETLSRYAFDKTWDLRSELDLLPMSVNPLDNSSLVDLSGVGASLDSFYEYALKGAILFDDESLMQVWRRSSHALKTYSFSDWFYANIGTHSGTLAVSWIDSLSAFFPGLLTLAGEVEHAEQLHILFLKLWDTYGGLPERWNINALPTNHLLNELTLEEKINDALPLRWYPLRPEFIESTYYLYRATKDPFYLNIGYHILQDFKDRFKGPCGFAGIQDIIFNLKQDRMETFVIGETLKYLFLLFDEHNELHHSRDNVVFSTEAHPFWITTEQRLNYQNNGTLAPEWEDIYYKGRNFSHVLPADDMDAFSDDRQYHTFMQAQPNIDVRYELFMNPGTCKVPWQFNLPVDQMWFSPLASSFDRLFEVERVYKRTLVRPRHWKDAVPIELDNDFYKRWVNPRLGRSLPAPTTNSFEIGISVVGPKDYGLRSPSHDYIFKTLRGTRKFRAEQLALGHSVDADGHYVDATIFDNAKYNDLKNSLCSRDPKDPQLFRITHVDGEQLPQGARIMVHRSTVIAEANSEEVPGLSMMGYNEQSQLIYNCVPFLNMYMYG